MTDDDSPVLLKLGESTHAYLQRRPGWGWNNAGAVIDPDTGDALLVDTCYTLDLTRALLAALPGTPRPGTLVLTHGNGDHAFGAGLMPDATLLTSAGTAASLEHEVGPETMRWLAEVCPDEPTREYCRRHFGAFDFTGAALREPDETFSGERVLTVGAATVRLIEVGPAHTEGDVIVHVPADGVVFAGDVVFTGDHPIAWSSLSGLARACDRVLETGAEVVVPGHGPLTTRADVERLRGYYRETWDQARALFDAGVPYQQAAARIELPPHFASWGLPERLVITVATAYREFGAAGDELPAVLGAMARFTPGGPGPVPGLA